MSCSVWAVWLKSGERWNGMNPHTHCMTTRRLMLSTMLLGSLAEPAMAAYPDRPIKLWVPWPVGGATDQVARMLGQSLSQALAQPVVVENKSGAGGVIGTQQFVKEKADGSALLLATSSTNAAAPYLYKRLGFDPIADFTPVSGLCAIPGVLVVPAQSPWHSLQEVIAAARQSPGRYTYGSSGTGGSQHLAGAQFKSVTGIDLRHVPYKGSGPAASDLMAGHIDMMIDTGSLGSIRGGLLRPLAVASERRLAALPQVPTFKESGVAMTASAWYGVMLPARAAPEVVERLNAEINKFLRTPSIRERLTAIGAEVMNEGTPAQFAAFVGSELRRYERVVEASGAPRE